MARLGPGKRISRISATPKCTLQVINYPSRTKLPDFVLNEIKWAKHSFVYAAGKWDQVNAHFIKLCFSFVLTIA